MVSKYPILSPLSNLKMLIRAGGESNGDSSRGKSECDIILFDPTNESQGVFQDDDDESVPVNAFYMKLPPLPVELGHTASVYHCGTIVVAGGLGTTTQNRIYELPFTSSEISESAESTKSTKSTETEWKWINSQKITVNERYGVKLQPIEGHNILMIGGFENSMASKAVDLFSVGNSTNLSDSDSATDSTNLNITEMVKARYKPGCCWESQRKRVVVGGGYGSKQSSLRSVEYCDLICDKWIEIKHQTLGEHMFSPVVWVDSQQPDIVYIGGREIGDHGLKYLEDIEYIDLRDNCGWSKYMAIESLFPTRHAYKSQFRSRALLMFEN